jgi:hypothetical protein
MFQPSDVSHNRRAIAGNALIAATTAASYTFFLDRSDAVPQPEEG